MAIFRRMGVVSELGVSYFVQKDKIINRWLRSPRPQWDEKRGKGNEFMSDEHRFGDAIARKFLRHVLWILLGLYFMAIIDRNNIAFAALQMNHDLGLTSAMFGAGIGIFYAAYGLIEIPSNLALDRWGARLTLSRIAFMWGLATIGMAAVVGPISFFSFRALLGAGEAGLFPGIMLYLTFWLPAAHRAQSNAMISYAVPISYLVSSLISVPLLALDGTFNLRGWQWLFIVEGLPTILLGLCAYWTLPNKPNDAKWLSSEEKRWLSDNLEQEQRKTAKISFGLLKAAMSPSVLSLCVAYFALFAANANLFSWMPQILKAYGTPNTQIGLLSAVPAAVSLIAIIAVARFSDKRKERFNTLIAALLAAMIGFVIVAQATAPTYIIIGFTIASVGVLSGMPVFWSIPQTYLSRSTAPGTIAFISMIGSLGGAATPTLIGHLKDTYHSFEWGFLLLSGLLATAILMLLIAKRLVANLQPSEGPADVSIANLDQPRSAGGSLRLS